MPYNTVCSYSFLEAHTGALSGIPRRFRVSFSRLDWQPAPFEIQPDGEPLELEWIDSDDNVYTPTRATRATFNLTVENWSPAVLNATGKYDIQVLIECDQTGTGDSYGIFFFGWVQPGDASDAYGERPNGKTIYATDGLSLLKDKPVLDQSGKRLASAQISLASILQHALANTGFYRPLSVGLNLYHLADFAAGQTVNGHPDPNRCPLDTARVASKWLTTDSNEVANCIDAIQAIVRPFGCQLGQWGGQWVVRRITELDGLHNLFDPLRQSVLFRSYTSPNSLYAGPDANSAQSIDMRVIVGRKDSGEVVRVLSGGPVETLTSPREAIKIEQNYGRYISEFPSGDLADADETGLPAGWDRQIFVPREAQRIGKGIEPDAPYQIKILGAGDNLNAMQKQSIGVRIQFPTGITNILPDFNRSKKWTIKGRYQLYKARAMQMSVVAVKSDGLYLADQSGEWKRWPSKKDNVTLRFDNAFGNGTIYNPTPTDFSITLNPIDKVTNLFIRFHDPEDLDKTNGQPGGQKNPDAYVLIWNLSLSTERDGLNLTGQNAIRSLSNRVKPDTLTSLTLGDVPDAASPYRHLGTLYDKAGNATGIWREARETLATLGKSLINTLADDAARQVMNVQPGFEGDVIGYLPWGPFSILLFLDIGYTNTDNLFIMTQHVITRWRYKVRSMVNTVSCVRIASDTAPFGPQPIPGFKKAYWQTPDGEILQSSDEATGQAVNPVPPIANPFPALSPIYDIISQIPGGINRLVPSFGPLLADSSPAANRLVVRVPGQAEVYVDPTYRPKPDFPLYDSL